MIKIQPSGDYVQLKYIDTVSEYVQEELKSDSDAIEYSSSSNGRIYLKFGRMTFEYSDPTEFEINGSAVTDAADFITKLTALFSSPGGGVTIYTGDGSLSGLRIIDLNGNDLKVAGVGGGYLFQAIYGDDGVTISNASLSNAVYVSSDIDGVKLKAGTAYIKLTNTGQKIEYEGDTHTFNGKVITPDLVALDFADDAAAATGGVAVGQWYHTSGTLKIRLA